MTKVVLKPHVSVGDVDATIAEIYASYIKAGSLAVKTRGAGYDVETD
jgi:hypothetical protein